MLMHLYAIGFIFSYAKLTSHQLFTLKHQLKEIKFFKVSNVYWVFSILQL